MNREYYSVTHIIENENVDVIEAKRLSLLRSLFRDFGKRPFDLWQTWNYAQIDRDITALCLDKGDFERVKVWNISRFETRHQLSLNVLRKLTHADIFETFAPTVSWWAD